MVWTINAEIFPHFVRSTGCAVATFFNWTFNLLISLTFLTLASSITKQGKKELKYEILISNDKFAFRCVSPLRGDNYGRPHRLLPHRARNAKQGARRDATPLPTTILQLSHVEDNRVNNEILSHDVEGKANCVFRTFTCTLSIRLP